MKFVVVFLLVLNFIFANAIDEIKVYKDRVEFYSKTFDNSKIGKVFRDDFITCEPKIDGIFHQESNELITFYSKTTLPTSTTFNCSYNDEKISFKSDKFQIEKFQKMYKNRYFISFNDEVTNLKENIKAITLDEKIVPFKLHILSSSEAIIEVLSSDSYTLKISKNVKNPKNSSVENDAILNSFGQSDDELKSSKTLELDTTLIKPLSYPDKMLGFRLYMDDYLWLNNVLVSCDDTQNFKVINSGYENSKSYFDIVSSDLKDNSEYEITLKKGFGEKNYKALKKDLKFRLKTADFAPEIWFLDDKPYISSKGKIALKSINLKEIKTVLSKVEDENLRYFLNFDDGTNTFSDEKSQNFHLDFEPNKEIKTLLEFDFDKDGIYNLEIFYKDKDERLKSINKFIYYSDLALHAKVFKDEIFVFVNRLSNNEVVKNAQITIFSNKNKIIAKGITDEKGVFKFSQKNIIDKKPKSILASLNSERNFLILDEFQNTNTTQEPVESTSKGADVLFQNLKSTQKPKAYAYLTSDIVRPNSEISGIIILKENFKSIKNLPIKVRVYDAQNSKIYEKSFILDEFGSLDFKIKNGFKTSGKQRLEVIFENKILARKEFFIESFIPQNLKANVKFSKEFYTKDEKPLLNLSANYLFGQNASNLSGDLSVSFLNSTFKNDKFKDFTFDDSSLNEKDLYFDEKTILLDENASSKILILPTFNAPLNSVINIKATFLLNDSGKNVAGYSQSKFYPFKSIVGINLEKNILDESQDLKASFITIDPATLNETKSSLKASLYKEEWIYTLDEKGFLSWFKKDSKLKDFDIKNNFLTVKNPGFGSYKLEVLDLNSSHKSVVSFEVSGFGSDELVPTKRLSKASIKTDKLIYNDNENISVTISSALKDPLMLVSFESDKLIDYKIAKLSGKATNLSFKVPLNFKGGYIKAKLLRLSDTPSTFLPFKAWGQIYIENNSSKFNLKPQILAPNLVKSAQNLEVEVRTKPNTKVALFGVEEGILNLLNQKSPKSYEFFKTKLAVLGSDFDIYDKLTNFINDGKVLKFGSGEMLKSAAMKKYLDPLENKKIDTFIFMQTAIADENGTAKFSKFIPANLNTKIRLDAIAIDENQIGEESTFVVIKDDILVKAPLIAYLLNGDEVNLIFKIFNNTNEKLKPKITLSKSPNLELSYDKNLSISQNSFKDLIVKTKALNLGKGDINITIDDKTTNLNFEILEPNSLNTDVKSGIINGKKEFMFDKLYKAKVQISSNLQTLFIDEMDKLINYPYGCSEQKSSQLLALMFLNPANKAGKIDRENFINLGIRDLLALQNENGDFGYWRANSNVDEFSSIYATHALLLLKENGFEVPKISLNKALKSLKQKGINSNLSSIYALYILSQNSKNNLDEKINLLLDNKFYKDDLLKLFLTAAILKNAGLNKELESIKEQIKAFEIDKMQNKELNFASKIRDLSFSLYLNLKYFKDDELSQKLLNEIILLKNSIRSTQDRAFVLLAINEFEKEQVKDKSLKIKVKNGDDLYMFSQNANLNMDLKDRNLTIESSNKAYYSLISYGYKPKPIKNSLEMKSLNIKREFVDSSGNLVNLANLKINDLIFAKITLKFNQNFNDILVYQKVPSCLEIVNERIIQNIRDKKLKDDISMVHKEIKDGSITDFLPPVYSGESITFYTPFKVVLSGTCKLPQANAESMYDEKINDYSLEAYEIKVK